MTGEASDRLVAYARRTLAECRRIDSASLARRGYRLPFVDLDCGFTDPRFAALCDRGLVERPSGLAAARAESVVVADAGGGAITPPLAWWEGGFGVLAVDRRLARHRLQASYFHDHKLWHFRDSFALFSAVAMQSPGAYPPWERSAPLRLLLHWVYASLGMRLVHAATLAYAGRGVLLAGQGGSGKSATTIAGVMAGLDSAGDDYVLIDLRDGPVAYPIFRLSKVDRAGYDRLGLLQVLSEPGPLNWQQKYEFDPETLGRGRRAQSLEIRALVMPRITGGNRTRIEPTSARDAMLALAPSGISQMHGERESGVRFFASLARSVPCFTMELGTDPSEIAAATAGLIEAT